MEVAKRQGQRKEKKAKRRTKNNQSRKQFIWPYRLLAKHTFDVVMTKCCGMGISTTGLPDEAHKMDKERILLLLL